MNRKSVWKERTRSRAYVLKKVKLQRKEENPVGSLLKKEGGGGWGGGLGGDSSGARNFSVPEKGEKKGNPLSSWSRGMERGNTCKTNRGRACERVSSSDEMQLKRGILDPNSKSRQGLRREASPNMWNILKVTKPILEPWGHLA